MYTWWIKKKLQFPIWIGEGYQESLELRHLSLRLNSSETEQYVHFVFVCNHWFGHTFSSIHTLYLQHLWNCVCDKSFIILIIGLTKHHNTMKLRRQKVINYSIAGRMKSYDHKAAFETVLRGVIPVALVKLLRKKKSKWFLQKWPYFP